MSLDTNSRAARPPSGSPSNVVPMRPPAVCRTEAATAYQVRAGGKIFQGRDLRALLKLAVAARTTTMARPGLGRQPAKSDDPSRGTASGAVPIHGESSVP